MMYDKNYNLAFAIMNGIKKSAFVNKNDNSPIKSQDFKIKNTIEMCSMSNKDIDIIKFTDFAPKVFKAIRIVYGISPTDYVESLGIQNLAKMNEEYRTLNQQDSSGKSGSIFFYTRDNKYMVKSISKSEFQVCQKILESYFSYIMNKPQTFIVKYFGLYQIQCLKKKKTTANLYVIVMKN